MIEKYPKRGTLKHPCRLCKDPNCTGLRHALCAHKRKVYHQKKGKDSWYTCPECKAEW
jgi:hypothetical protein